MLCGALQGISQGITGLESATKIELCNVDFREFDISRLDSRDFVYIDPPIS